MSLSLNERIRIIGSNTSLAWASFDIWWTYASHETRPDYLETMNQFSEFFRFDEHAHFVNMIMLVSSLYDPTGKTITVRSVINKAVAEGHTALKGMVPVCDTFADDAAIKGVLHMRNKLYAHRDTASTVAGVYADAALTADDIRDLIQRAQWMIDRVVEVVGGQPVVRNTIVGEHVSKMLKTLKKEDRRGD
ncbi:hypothetical protein D3C72_377350 [compost metagenome]